MIAVAASTKDSSQLANLQGVMAKLDQAFITFLTVKDENIL